MSVNIEVSGALGWMARATQLVRIGLQSVVASRWICKYGVGFVILVCLLLQYGELTSSCVLNWISWRATGHWASLNFFLACPHFGSLCTVCSGRFSLG